MNVTTKAERDAVLTFVIPVRHPENASDWSQLKDELAQTVASIAAQRDARWNAVIVANAGADLPTLPDAFSVTRVDFPPNPLHTKDGTDLETFYDAVRFDKGRRILAGLIDVRPDGYIMVVDADDFISRELTGFVADHRGANGWYFRHGLVWSPGARLMYRHPDFSNLCGTSHIIRADLYDLPSRLDEASETYIKEMLGSHRFAQARLDAAGTPLAPLPFDGAVYRVGHASAHSRSSTVVRHYFGRDVWRHPRELARRAFRLRLLTPARRSEFFGGR